jgi:PleD family two-component response regulator
VAAPAPGRSASSPLQPEIRPTTHKRAFGRRAACLSWSAAARLPTSDPCLLILLVDDHPLTRDGLAALLGGHRFEVVGQAGDGPEAIDLAGELQPDVILLDLSMPGIDGLQALPGCEPQLLAARSSS